MEHNPPPERSNPPEEAVRFLECIAPGETKFTFQTFDDVRVTEPSGKKRKRGYSKLVTLLHGTLTEYLPELTWLNSNGAGIYVCVNRTDLRGREATNIVGIRANFADLDGAPLEPLVSAIKPTVVVESSPGKFQAHFRVTDEQPDAFADIQKRLAAKFGGDEKVHDLPRVMRLPGFYHRKDEASPFLSRIVSADPSVEYTAEAISAAIGEIEVEAEDESRRVDPDEDGRIYEGNLNSFAMVSLDTWVPELFGSKARKTAAGGYRIPPAELGRDDLEEELSIDPRGIRDWGLADQPGEEREGRRSPIDVVMEFGHKDYAEAVAWLSNALGFESIEVTDFHALSPSHNYLFAPTSSLWNAAGVTSRFGRKGKVWIDKNQSVDGMTWAPGEPLIIHGKLMAEGGWVQRPGAKTYNLYRPPTVKLGDASLAKLWVDHVRKTFPDDAEHILDYCAHTVQNPAIKINHALVLHGQPGIGKDTLLAPLRQAVGPWNWEDIVPKDLFGQFNKYQRTKVLRINELGNLGDGNRYKFWEATKNICAAPPDDVRINEKHLREYYAPNCCSTIMTTNPAEGGLFLLAEDRRHYIASTKVQKEDFDQGYFNDLWRFYREGGDGHVAAFLHERDLSRFDPKAPPKKTPMFWEIVRSSRPAIYDELVSTLDELGDPPAVTLDMLGEAAGYNSPVQKWLEDRAQAKLVPNRMREVGYSKIDNPDRANGFWIIRVGTGNFLGGEQVLKPRRISIYAKVTLTDQERRAAAEKLVRDLEEKARGGQR